MTTYAALTDGTTTVTFASPGNGGLWYRIEDGWAPKIASQRVSKFGGRGPYEDVTEEIPISVGGSNAAHLYANVNTLKALLNKSNAWYQDYNESAVTFRYSPEGATVSSTASPLQSAIWDTGLEFPSGWPRIPQAGTNVWTTGLTLRFSRQGTWLHNAVTSASATQPAAGSGYSGSPISYAFSGSTSYRSPTSIYFTNAVFYKAGSPQSMFLVGEGTDSFVMVQAEQATSSSSGWFSRVADSNAFGGSVLRVTPSSTSASTTSIFAASMAGSPRRVGVMIGVRANGANTDWMAKVNVYTPGSGGSLSNFAQSFSTALMALETQYDSLEAQGNPAWQVLGLLSPSNAPRYMSITVQASSAAETLDIDGVVLFDYDKVNVFGVNVNNINGVQASGAVLDRSLTAPTPQITMYIDSSASTMTANNYGNMYLSTSSASVGMLLIASGNWGAGLSASLVRTTSYLTPV